MFYANLASKILNTTKIPILIPLKNPDGKISHTFELGYITKKRIKMGSSSACCNKAETLGDIAQEKIIGYNNEYDATKEKIVKLVGRLQELDKLYIKANEELKKRGVLNDE